MSNTGYPSIDKPWLKYYSQEAINSRLSEKCMYQYLFDDNQNRLSSVAISYFDKKFTYYELIENIKHTAAALKELGIKKGDVVSFCTVTVPEVIYSFYALNMIGAIANMIDPRTSVEGISSYIEESNSKYLIVLDMLQSRLEPIINGNLIKQAIVISPGDSMPAIKKTLFRVFKRTGILNNKCISWDKVYNSTISEPFIPREYEKDLPVSIMHTGGTTGTPKGVLFSDDSYNQLNDQFNHYDMQPDSGDVFLNIMPPFIAYGMAVGIHEMLCCGCKIVLIPSFDPGKLDKLVIKYKPQHFWGVPTHLDGLRFSKKLTNSDLSFLVTAGVGGDALKTDSEKVIGKFLHAHGCLYGVTKGYGMTEVNSAVCVCGKEHNKIGSVGIPLVHTTVAAFNPGTQNELPYGEQGEICLQTPSRMLGYYNNPEETGKVMQVHKDGKVWIHSGDMGYVTEDGYVYIVDRIKRMIIREDGFKVYPSVIENVICECSGVKDCAVVGVRNELYTQGVVPKAFITIGDSDKSDKIIGETQKLCKQKLAEYQIPVEIEVLEELPLTKVGKIDYQKLEMNTGKNA